MPPIRERGKSAKRRGNEEIAAILAAPRATPRAHSRPGVARTPSTRLGAQDLLNKADQAISKAQRTLPNPEDTGRAQSTQVVRESVPPKPRTQSFPRASLLDFPYYTAQRDS
jgi:hypothetical protein